MNKEEILNRARVLAYGEVYSEGSDKKAALKLLADLLAVGDADAMNLAAHIYLDADENDNIAHDIEKGVNLLFDSVDDCLNSKYDLGMFYYKGQFGLEQDIDEALSYLVAAGKEGHIYAQRQVGYIMASDGNPEGIKTAVGWYAAAAEQGDAEARNELATLYDIYRNTFADGIDTIPWLEEAAELGFPDAMIELADAYYNGEEVEQDIRKWIDLIFHAAALGNQRALYLSGVLLIENDYLEPDIEEGLDRLEASRYPYVNGEADCYLADLYYEGKVVPQDYKKTADYLLDAARGKDGFPPAQYKFAQCCQYGIGVEKDLKRALSFYKKAAQQGIKEAEEAVKELEKLV